MNVIGFSCSTDWKIQNTAFLRIEVALEYRPPPIRSHIKPENFILKATDNRNS